MSRPEKPTTREVVEELAERSKRIREHAQELGKEADALDKLIERTRKLPQQKPELSDAQR